MCSSASSRPFTKADEGANLKVNLRPQTVSVDGRIRHVGWDGDWPESCTGTIEQVTDGEVMMQGGRSIPNGIPHPIEWYPDPLQHLAAPHEMAVLPSVTESKHAEIAKHARPSRPIWK